MINPTKTYNKCYLLWQKLPLKDFCKKCTIKNIDRRYNTVFTNSAIHGVIKQSDYFEKDVANSENTDSYYVVYPEDFIYNPRISENAPYGPIRANETEEYGVVSPLYFVFRLIDKTLANYDYLKYYFASSSWHRYVYSIGNNGARSDRMNISDADFMAMPIALPPLEEQRRIAEILGCCDRVIALKKELIAEKKKQKKALMQKLLNPDSGFRLPGFSGEWKKRQLKQVTEYVDYRGKTPIKTNWGVPLITARNIKNGKIDFHESQEFISEKDYSHVMRRGQPQLGDVLITTEAPLGSVAQIIDPHVALAQRIIKYRGINNILNNNFLAYYLASDNFQLELLSLATGCTAKGIKGATLHELEICYPAIAEQQAIADILSAADKEIDLLEQELVQQEQKKKSLMQLLLTGIVRV